MIAYYRFIGDIESEKRQILIYLEENIDEKELVGIYERLIEFPIMKIIKMTLINIMKKLGIFI